MSFGDWEGDLDDMAASLEVTNPIRDSGSLLLSSTLSVSANQPAATRHLNSNFTRGFAKGRVRTLVRYDYAKQAYNTTFPGVYCLSTVGIASGANGTLTYYAAGTQMMSNDPNAPDSTHYIMKQVSGDRLGTLVAGDAIADTKVLSGGLVQGDILPVQLEWVVDEQNLGGTRLIYSVGNVGDEDFTNLAIVYDLVDNVSPITSGDREGVHFYVNNGTFGLAVGEGATFDQTSVFQLV